MNSRNMPEEEELDNMFRQAADSFEPEFDPEAWRQMEKKLDEPSQKPAAFGKWAKRSLLALLLLVSGWVVYHFAQRETAPSSVQNTTIQKNIPPVAGTPEQITPEKTSSGNQEPLVAEKLAGKAASTNLPAAREQTDQPTRLLQRPNASVTSAQGRTSKNKFSSARTKQNGIVPAGISRAGAANSNLNLKNDSVQADASTLGVAGKEMEPAVNPAILPGTENPAVDSTAQPVELNTAIIPDSKLAALDSVKIKPAAAADSALPKVPATFLSKVSVSLVFGPDFSTVGFVRPEKASTNVGVLLSYSFGRRWAVSTGVVHAKKVYGAKPEDYHPGANYWPAGQHLPDDINAVCKVLDIPINVRYAVVALPRQSIYVQTGLSSYIMLNENYRYDYSNYGNPYSKHWIVSNQNQHFFQVLNLSVGYSKQIKPGITVGAEPFAKIPLAGIGAGKVNLTSLGAFFSLGYRFR